MKSSYSRPSGSQVGNTGSIPVARSNSSVIRKFNFRQFGQSRNTVAGTRPEVTTADVVQTVCPKAVTVKMTTANSEKIRICLIGVTQFGILSRFVPGSVN